MTFTIVPVLVWIFTGLLLVLLIACVLAGRGTLPRNHAFGVRIPALLHSDDAWRAGHAAGILPATIAFVAALVCSLIGLAVPLVDLGAIVAAVGGGIVVFAAASHAARRAD